MASDCKFVQWQESHLVLSSCSEELTRDQPVQCSAPQFSNGDSNNNNNTMKFPFDISNHLNSNPKFLVISTCTLVKPNNENIIVIPKIF